MRLQGIRGLAPVRVVGASRGGNRGRGARGSEEYGYEV